MTLARTYARALAYLAAERREVATICLVNLFLAATAVLEPVTLGKVFDAVSDRSEITPALMMWGALGVFNIIGFVFVARQSDRLSHRNRLALLARNYEKVMALPLSWHHKRGTSHALHTLLRGIDTLSGLWLEFMRQHLSTAIALIFLLPTAIYLDWRLTVVLIALGVAYMTISRIVMKKTEQGQRSVERYHHQVFSHVSDTISNVSLLQSYHRVAAEVQSLRGFTTQLLEAQYPVLNWWAFAAAMHRLSSTMSMGVVLAIGAMLVDRGELRIGELIAFTGFAGLLISRLDQVAGFFNQIFEARARLIDFYAIEDEADPEAGRSHLPDIHVHDGSVAFENVSFTYPGAATGLKEINLTVPAGKTVAIVGPTGSGKTTLVNLLQRTYEPDDGRILIDGQDVREVSLRSLRRSIATVFQDSCMLNRTIEENIRLGRDAVSNREVEDAARAAAAHDFITAKGDGYATAAGDRGGQLSGGERQRIAVARAVLKNAPILVLDEATSALDVETEMQVKNALDDIRRDKTTFVIAHRLSTVRDADLILYMDDGRIVESGSYDELAVSEGRFADLLRIGGLIAEPVPVPADLRVA
ncbi:MAG TPA: glucan ABC transporter ATP-binding protein/ permease [Rhizobiaceae bacterium]|nr:glucan ABC transporter ATP-binding protein/ permease [Rhizobiaceae bacterium]